MNAKRLEERVEELGVVRTGEQPTQEQLTKQNTYIKELDEHMTQVRTQLKNKLASSYQSAQKFILAPPTQYRF